MARAMWKGVIRLDDASVPVKLYSAIEDRGIHFRLLHEKDLQPIQQRMVNPETGEAVPYEEIRRGYPTEDGPIVILEPEELDELEPEPSRDIEVSRFLPPESIGHPWYDRPYYLGPDGSEKSYFSLVEALERSGKHGLVRWVMRKKEYDGVLKAREGHLMLITLRSAEEVVSRSELGAPSGRELSEKELSMAEELISALADEFDPSAYESEYRQRVMELIERKARGETVELEEYARERREREPLEESLRASLEEVKKSA